MRQRQNIKICLICSILFTSTYILSINKDSLYRKGVFVSLNGLANGVVDNVTKEQFTHAVITPEVGYWLKSTCVAGVSASFGFTSGNTGAQLKYLQQEYTVFCKYFPFQKKGWRWIGWQLQTGLSNSCMLPTSLRQTAIASIATGPVINAGKRFAFTYTFPFYIWQSKSCPTNFNFGNASAHVRPHLGISYTFGIW